MSKGISRRKFLKGSVSVASAAAAAGLVPTFSVAHAQQNGNGNNLIIIDLNGGYDGLSYFPLVQGPLADYLDTVRPTINVRTQTWPGVGGEGNLDPIITPAMAQVNAGNVNKYALHPYWRRMAQEAGNGITIIPSWGTTQFVSGSHETMQDIYRIGARNFAPNTAEGWFARLMRAGNMNMFQAWGIGNFSSTLSFKRIDNAPDRPLIISRMTDYTFINRDFGNWNQNVPGQPNPSTNATQDSAHARETMKQLFALSKVRSDLEGTYGNAGEQMSDSIDRVQTINALNTVGDYDGANTNFKRQCRDVAKVLIGKEADPNLRTKPTIIMMQRGGHDMHDNLVAGVTATIRNDMDRGLAGLIADLKNSNIFNKTAIIFLTEFGRTTRENGGFGTDHAHGNTCLVISGATSRGIAGPAPSLTDLQTGNRYTAQIDFRAPYEAAISWLGLNPATIFTEPHTSHASQLNLFS